MTDLINNEPVEELILSVRGKQVLLDFDLARLYGVETRILKQAVRRNLNRFPIDFMFQLTWEETQKLHSRSQIVTLNRGKNIKYLPSVFTQEGIAMLSGVLRSEKAVQINIEIMRAFVKLRQIAMTHAEIYKKFKDYDSQLDVIFKTLDALIKPIKEKIVKVVGFKPKEDKNE